jgi:RNA polymerase sigma-70 factor (ECF subfamily)
MDEDERAAIARLRAGDAGGLEALVAAYYPRALRSAYLVTQDHTTAEDVAQAAFIKAYERIHRFDPQRPFGPWFLKSVLRDAVKAAQRRRRSVPLEGQEAEMRRSAGAPVDEGNQPESLWQQRETAHEVATALAALPPKQRAAVVQRYYLGLTEADMARADDCPPGTIKSRLNAARERLRVLLQPLMQDSEGLQ